MNAPHNFAFTRRQFMGGLASLTAATALWPRSAECEGLNDLGPLRHAHFEVAAPSGTHMDSPMHALGPAAAVLHAQVLRFAQMRGDAAHFVGATLQHDAQPLQRATHLVLSSRFSDGSTATFTVSPRLTDATHGTLHFQNATVVIAAKDTRGTRNTGETWTCSPEELACALSQRYHRSEPHFRTAKINAVNQANIDAVFTGVLA